jgi:hypothetical protein
LHHAIAGCDAGPYAGNQIAAREEGSERLEQETNHAMRQLQSSDEYEYKGQLLIAALTLPYLKGVVLYFLAVTFPFFACIGHVRPTYERLVP